jgi:hypothetical protein
MERIHIIIDTREQTPWGFDPSQAVVSVDTLRTGDYALKGDGGFAIERKSLDDFLGTISSGWDRFLREIGRMDGAGFSAKAVIVEADFESCCFRTGADGELIPPGHRHPMLSPQFVCKRIAELTMMGVAVLFAGTPLYASALAYQILRERANDLARKG